MKQDVYLSELSQHLRRLPDAEIREILADYEEHFHSGRAAGKSDDVISAGLGQPKAVAHEILIHNLVSAAETSETLWQRSQVLLRMLGLFLILAPFNFLILLGPFLILVCGLIVGWCLPLTSGCVALAAVFVVIKSLFAITTVGALSFMSVLCMWIGTLGLTVLLAVIMTMLSKFALKASFSYVKWNVNIITSQKT